MPLYPPSDLDGYRSSMRILTTKFLLVQQEYYRWDLADIDTDFSADYPRETLAFLQFKLDEIERELERRRELLAHPGSPAWPDPPRISAEVWEAIKDQLDLKEFIDHQVRGLRWVRSGGRLKTNCPLGLHRDTDPSFVVFPDQHFYCFACGIGGSVIDFAAAFFGLTPQQAIADLAAAHHITRPSAPAAVSKRSQKRRVKRRDGQTTTTGS